MENTIKDIVYAFAIGDALGVPFEFKDSVFCKKYFKGKYESKMSHNQDSGVWSDDTSILLCVLDSKGNIDNYKKNIVSWSKNDKRYNCFDIFDIGNSFRSAINKNFPKAKNDNKGNGCLVVALGCYILNIDKRSMIEFVKLTHNNLESIKASVRLFDFFENGKGVLENKQNVINKGLCADSLILSFRSYKNSKNFKDAIRNAINFGFDTDSHAAVAAAMSTIKHKIPQTAIDGLKGKEKIDNILKQLL